MVGASSPAARMPPPRRNVARRETGAFDIGKPPRSSEMANSRALGEPSTEGRGTGMPWPPVPSSSCRGRRARWESPSLPEEPPGGIRKIGSTVLGHDSPSNHSRRSSHADRLESDQDGCPVLPAALSVLADAGGKIGRDLHRT